MPLIAPAFTGKCAQRDVAIPDADMVFNAHVDANKVISNNPTVLYHVAKGLQRHSGFAH